MVAAQADGRGRYGMATKTKTRVALRVSLRQRKVLLERLRREVGAVVEDLTGTAETMRVVSPPGRRTATERAAVKLVMLEQVRLRGELARLWGEYETLALRETQRGGSARRAA